MTCRALEARRLLLAEFEEIEWTGQLVPGADPQPARKRLFATHYSLPVGIAAIVDTVYGISGVPLVSIPRPAGKLRAGDGIVANGSPEAQGFSPNVDVDILKRLYNVSGVTVQPSTANKQAIVSFLGQTFSRSDLSTFFETYVTNGTVPNVTCFPEQDSCTGSSDSEASLDIQYLMGMAPGVPTEGWYVAAQSLCSLAWSISFRSICKKKSTSSCSTTAAVCRVTRTVRLPHVQRAVTVLLSQVHWW